MSRGGKAMPVVLGPVLRSHWVHGGLDEDGGHVLPVNEVKGHPLLRSEVTTFSSVTMRMDTYLSLSPLPQCCSGSFDEGDDDTGLPVVGSRGVRLSLSSPPQ